MKQSESDSLLGFKRFVVCLDQYNLINHSVNTCCEVLTVAEFVQLSLKMDFKNEINFLKNDLLCLPATKYATDLVTAHSHRSIAF